LGGLVSVAKFLVLISCVLNVMVQLNILDKSRTKDSKLGDKVMWITSFAVEKVASADIDFKEVNELFKKD
jgi:hypothetical protein